MTSTPLTLTDFLLARIAEDEVAARRAGAESWWHRSLMRHQTSRQSVHADDHEIAEVEHLYGWHIARWDPARVLAECEAKRQVVELHQPEPGQHPDFCGHDLRGMPCPTLRLLALPYADHPDYQQEWKP